MCPVLHQRCLEAHTSPPPPSQPTNLPACHPHLCILCRLVCGAVLMLTRCLLRRVRCATGGRGGARAGAGGGLPHDVPLLMRRGPGLALSQRLQHVLLTAAYAQTGPYHLPLPIYTQACMAEPPARARIGGAICMASHPMSLNCAPAMAGLVMWRPRTV